MTHSETSTGVVHDVEAIAGAVAPTGAVLVVDAVSSLGGIELATDAWGVDVVVSGSQKALMCPPGLAFASVSKRAWERVEHARLPRYYLDWRRTADSQAKGDTAFTPAVSLVARSARRSTSSSSAARRTCGSTTGGWRARPARA